jgi:hypothetical protein
MEEDEKNPEVDEIVAALMAVSCEMILLYSCT